MKSKYQSIRSMVAPVVGGALAAAVALPALSADVTAYRLENADAEPQNWLSTFGNYQGHRYSRLNQINRDNVGGLRVAYIVPLAGTALDGNLNAPNAEGPINADGGILFTNDGWGNIYKIDGRSGNRGTIVWVADPATDKEAESPRTRGVALWANNVYGNNVDGRVVAVDRETGEFVWDVQIARTALGYENLAGGPDAEHFVIGEKFTAAPLAVGAAGGAPSDGILLVGQSAGDWGTRGWLAGLDTATGEELWRTYTIPAPGEFGHETWADDHNAWRTGGASLWTTGTYDPDSRLTIWGTANPVPMFDPEFRPGDNLYTDSAVAFNVDDGSIAWYFQYIPNESWDYDEIGVNLLYDVDGQKRMGHFARNGFYYQFDRTDGTFIGYGQYVAEVTWTAGLDPKTGLPIEYDPSKLVQTYIPATRNSRSNPEVISCPTPAGGLRWQPPAFNPVKMLAYGAGDDGCTTVTVGVEEVVGAAGGNPKGPGAIFLGGGGGFTSPFGSLTAMDVLTNRVAAKQTVPWGNQSGVMATAGGLVFTVNRDGSIVAYNDEDLTEMWSFNTGITTKAPITSWAVGGKQFIGVFMNGRAGTGYDDLATQISDAFIIVFTL
ncbi:MAG: PQQ-binding-like beta-propeller repeat protein [Proteobacteria bacterium]|nr:PQQ-binding-like beta-propeller repeat protein [Pseudomonadota bacterium]